jgi:hypothetical protein
MNTTTNYNSNKTTFLTEVQVNQPIKDLSQYFFNHSLNVEDESEKKTINSCRYPSSFEGMEPQPFPKKVDPMFIIRKAVSQQCPEMNTMKDNIQKHKSQQFQNIFYSKINQDFLMDSFWWIFIEVFGNLFCQSKALKMFKIQLPPSVPSTGRSTDRSSIYTHRTVVTESSHPSDILVNENAVRWIEDKFNKMKADQEIIFSRMARNYSELSMLILASRHTKNDSRQKEKFMKKQSSDNEKVFPELTIRSLFISFGANFPDSQYALESKDFQDKLSEKVYYWLYGNQYSFLAHGKEMNLHMTPRTEAIRTVDDGKPIHRLKRVVNVLNFISRARKEVNKHNAEIEEKLEQLRQQLVSIQREATEQALTSLDTMFESLKEEVSKQYKDYLEEQRKDRRRKIRRGEISPDDNESDYGSSDDDYSDVDSAVKKSWRMKWTVTNTYLTGRQIIH